LIAVTIRTIDTTAGITISVIGRPIRVVSDQKLEKISPRWGDRAQNTDSSARNEHARRPVVSALPLSMLRNGVDNEESTRRMRDHLPDVKLFSFPAFIVLRV
jgi:hypothetical protein